MICRGRDGEEGSHFGVVTSQMGAGRLSAEAIIAGEQIKIDLAALLCLSFLVFGFASDLRDSVSWARAALPPNWHRQAAIHAARVGFAATVPISVNAECMWRSARAS